MAYQNNETFTQFRPLPRLGAAIQGLFVAVLKSGERQRSRRALEQLDAHLLQDIGLTDRAARHESNKSFWQA